MRTEFGIPIGSEGYRWFLRSWNSDWPGGLLFSRYAKKVMLQEEIDIVALVGNPMSGDALVAVRGNANLLDFESWGFEKLDAFNLLARFLKSEFPRCQLVLELPLVSPGGKYQSRTNCEIVTFDDQVFEVVDLQSPTSKIEEFLRWSASWCYYNVFVVSGPSITSDLLTKLSDLFSIEAAIAGAYDGEGLLLATRK